MQLLRYTLDLFGLPAGLAQPPVPPNSRPNAPKKTVEPKIQVLNLPDTLAKRAGAATDFDSAHATPDLLGPRYQHPHANRQALLQGHAVAYELRRAKRRSIGFVIGAQGLAVRAPSWVPLAEIDRALQEKAAWIVQKLAESQQRKQQGQAAQTLWQDGAEVQFLGQAVRVLLSADALPPAAAVLMPAEADQPPRLSLGLPASASPEQIKAAVQAWLMRQGAQIYQERLNHFAPLLGVRWTKLRLSNAGTRWGSAKTDGSIRLHWRLVHFGLPVIDYVVVHELSHLRVMNHSPRFWQTVAAALPGYAEQVKFLKKNTLVPWQ
jgi:predicted metal-dependent hydrolase